MPYGRSRRDREEMQVIADSINATHYYSALPSDTQGDVLEVFWYDDSHLFSLQLTDADDMIAQMRRIGGKWERNGYTDDARDLDDLIDDTEHDLARYRQRTQGRA